MLNPKNQIIVIFNLEELHYALFLPVVERVVFATEITPLLNVPAIVSGVVNFHGQIIPVINIRKRFGLQDQSVKLEDHFIIVNTSKRKLVLVVDAVTEIYEATSAQLQAIDSEKSFGKYLKGIAKIDSNIIMIHDLEMLLSQDEESLITEALSDER